MELTRLAQPNAAAAHPVEVALPGFLMAPDSICPIPLPSAPRPTGEVSLPLAKTAALSLTFPPRPAPPAVGPLLAAALDSRWQLYRDQLQRCQEKFSEGTVHELRVATRRLLAQFTLLSCVVPNASLEKARRMLKRRLAALGDLRDTQVQRRFTEQKVVSFPELVLLRGWLLRRERRFSKSAWRKISRFKTRKLERWVAGMIGDLNANAGRSRAQTQLAGAVLRAAAQAFAEAVERRQAIDLADMRTIHQTRVAFKRFRYILESLSPGMTGLSRRQLRVLAYYQRKMGIIQDLEVLQACVARYIREDRKREVLLKRFVGRLRQRRARALQTFLKSADRIFDFWPPATVAARSVSFPARNAA